MKQPIFIAHRGAYRAGRRENTVAAIARSANSGRFAYIEVDVRRSRSDDSAVQTPILMHDETLDRLYDLYSIPIIKRHRSKQPIHGLTIDIIRNEEIEVATLAEGMRAAAGHPMNIELKAIEAIDSTLETVADMIKKYDEWSWEKIVFSSFDWQILREIKTKVPEASVAILYGWKNLPRNFVHTYYDLDARFVKFNKFLAPLLSPLSIVYGIKNRGVYTVNHALEVRILYYFGIRIFTTDFITLPDSFSDKN